MTDVIARDDEIGTVICDTAHHEMHMRVVGVPMGDADPVQPGAKIALHLAGEVACRALRSVISAASPGVATKRK
jgi:hypothetical protein